MNFFTGLLDSLTTEIFWNTIVVLVRLAPIWLPILLFVAFFPVWVRYIKIKFIIKQGSTLLEIRLPKEITKSPVAMEIFLTSLYFAGKTTYLDSFIGGKVRPWFSLELVSLGGKVKFFIWTQTKYKNHIESQLYSQFPTIEVYEVPDYSVDFSFKPAENDLWGMSFKLSKADVYPIKTYIDYEMDKDKKEEYKIDPMTSVLELLGSLKEGEQLWIQILIQAHRKEDQTDIRFSKKPDWSKDAEKEKKSLLKALEDKDGKQRMPTKGESEVIAAIERSISKYPFECTIRGLYLSKKETFNGINISALIGSMKQYSSNTLNGFKLGWCVSFDYPWQDFRKKRSTHRKKLLLDAYKSRSFFQPPHKGLGGKPFILNTEELATIWHFPGSVAATPTFSRIESKKAEAPSNLPI